MVELEEEIFENQNLNRIYGAGIMMIYFPLKHGEEKLKCFIENTNKIHPTIFTVDWPKASIIFLDVTVSIAEGIIETDLYVKPTDSYQYLLPSSYHHFYCKKGIPYSQALRLNGICSNDDFFGK